MQEREVSRGQRLELAQAGGEGGLGDETGVGGTAEMARVLQRNEILQLLQRREVGRCHGVGR